jgi:polyvinyl alcohol dehydrogenase (cytochrome)
MDTRHLIHGAAVLITCATLIGASAIRAQQPAGAISAAEVFNARCKGCHDPAIERAPGRAELALRAQADIVASLTSGIMKDRAEGLSASQIAAVAQYLAPGTPTAVTGTDRLCSSHPPLKAAAGDWSSLGADQNSSRFQPNPGLRASDVPKLTVKWAFSMPGGGQPIVIGDYLFMTNRGGKFYALDARSGCVHWAIEGTPARATPSIVRSSVSPSGWLALVGVSRSMHALDAQNGKEIWHSEPLESHSAAGISGAPAVSGEQIFVPLSSGEEGLAAQPKYACCSFRGSLVALDLTTGHKQWQTYSVSEPLHPIRTNASGITMQGPAGGAIWAAPTVDTRRGVVYVVTGDSYTEAKTDGADAIIAIDMKTGAVRWKNQVTPDDNYILGCTGGAQGANCPTPFGPDFDFGASALLVRHGFRQILIAGQKSGIVYGVDPGTGRTRWSTVVGQGSSLGGVEWGIGADNHYVFVPNSDVNQLHNLHGLKRPTSPERPGSGNPGLTALDPFTGKVVWQTPAPDAPCHYAGDRSKDYVPGVCIRAQSAAPGVIPGIVFSGTLDGWFRAYDARTGQILWAFSTTAQSYDTVNGIHDQPGGSIDGMGPTIAHGMVYLMSGFNGASRTGGNGVNVLLAFGLPEGRR